jgi:hypothetical protein
LQKMGWPIILAINPAARIEASPMPGIVWIAAMGRKFCGASCTEPRGLLPSWIVMNWDEKLSFKAVSSPSSDHYHRPSFTLFYFFARLQFRERLGLTSRSLQLYTHLPLILYDSFILDVILTPLSSEVLFPVPNFLL